MLMSRRRFVERVLRLLTTAATPPPRELDLRAERLAADDARALATALGASAATDGLQSADLRGCELDGAALAAILEPLQRAQQLTYVDCSGATRRVAVACARA